MNKNGILLEEDGKEAPHLFQPQQRIFKSLAGDTEVK
jgi:hypothetical protein